MGLAMFPELSIITEEGPAGRKTDPAAVSWLESGHYPRRHSKSTHYPLVTGSAALRKRTILQSHSRRYSRGSVPDIFMICDGLAPSSRFCARNTFPTLVMNALSVAPASWNALTMNRLTALREIADE